MTTPLLIKLVDGWECKISGPLCCLLTVSELLVSWSPCLKSLVSDSKSSPGHSWEAANHKQVTCQGAFCDSRRCSCCFSTRLPQRACAMAVRRAGGHGMGRHEQKESSEQGLALFYIAIHRQSLNIIAALPENLAVTATVSRGSVWAKMKTI